MTNLFLGLARGPIDHEASSVINAIANEQIDMGNAVKLVAAPSLELLPRVENGDTQGEFIYGIVVGGDADGIFGDGAASTDDLTRATLTGAKPAESGVVVVTQGRCLARVSGANQAGAAAISVGDPLVSSDDTVGELFLGTAADTDEEVIARALQPVASGEIDIIAIDVQREGVGVQ